MATASPVHMSLNSTIDVQGTITKLLAAETAKITQVQNKQTDLLSDVTAWGDITSSLSILSDSLYTLRNWATWNKMAVTSTDSAKLTATASSGALESTYSITTTYLAQAHSIASSTSATLGITSSTEALVGKVAGLADGDQFKIGGADGQVVTIVTADTLSTLRDKINTASGLLTDAADKVVASVLDNRLVITRVNTGNTDIDIADETGTPLVDLGIKSGGVFTNQLVAKQDALFSINGATITRRTNSNLTDVIENVTLNLRGTAAIGDNLKLTIGKDTSTARTAIDDFTANYNAAVAKLKSYVEIDLTDPKNPKVGELQGDNMVSDILFNMRKLMGQSKAPYMDSTNASYTYNGRTGVVDSIEDIGVWTSGKENTVSITDSDKLDYMLANNFDKVEQLFRGVYSDPNGYEHGVATDFYNYADKISTSMTGDIAKHVETIQKRVDVYSTSIDTMTTNLSSYEQSLWTQFDAMDQAMSNMTSQLAYITSTFGSK